MRIGGLLNYHLSLSLFFLIGKCKLEIALSQEHLPKKLRPERREENEKSVALREKNVILMNGILRVWFVPYQKVTSLLSDRRPLSKFSKTGFFLFHFFLCHDLCKRDDLLFWGEKWKTSDRCQMILLSAHSDLSHLPY